VQWLEEKALPAIGAAEAGRDAVAALVSPRADRGDAAFEEIPVSVELNGNNETNLVQEVGRLNRVSIEDRLRKFRGHDGPRTAIDGPLPSESGFSGG